MAHTKSAEKRLRKSESRRLRNRAVKSEIKTEVKRLRSMIKDKNVEQAQAQLKLVESRLDKAGNRRYLHPNTTSRLKSRLNQAVGALKSAK